MSNLGQALLIPGKELPPRTIATDAFTAADGTALTTYNTHWIKHISATNTVAPTIGANRVYGENAATTSVYYRDDVIPGSPNYSVEADVIKRSTGAGVGSGVVGRVVVAAASNYLWRYQTTTNAWQLFKVVTGTTTQLGSDVLQALTIDQAYRARLVMRGSAISGMVDGVTVITVTDTAITAAGLAGIRLQLNMTTTTGIHLDNFTVIV